MSRNLLRRAKAQFPMPSPATHLRAPLLWLLLPLMAGLIAAKLWPPPSVGLGSLGFAAGALAVAAGWCALRPGAMAGILWSACVALAGALAGFVLLHVIAPNLHQPHDRPPREIAVTLEVLQIFPAAPWTRNLTGLGRITAAADSDRELVGRRLYFSAIRKVSVLPERSGRYVLRGVFEPLPQGPAAAGFNDYLANLGIREKLSRAQIIREERPPNWFRRFCSRAENRLEQILRLGLEKHPAVSSLYLGMLLGEKAVLSADQQNAFMRSGTFHIFSISGLHVGVIAVALQSLLRLVRVPRRPAVIITLSLLWLYVQITGASSPAERSWLMIAFLLGSQVFRLPGNGLAALAAAALVTLLLDPLQLFSTGFQMSYTVVTALVVMGVPLAEKWLARWRPFHLLPIPDWRWYHRFFSWLSRIVVGSVAACWVAFLASAPSGIGYFEVLSPGSLVANLVIIPVSSLALIAGFLALLTGLCGLLPLCMLFNAAAAVTLICMDWLVLHGTDLPGVYFPAQFKAAWLAPVSLGLMLAVMLAGLAGGWSKRYGGYWPPVVVLLLLIIFGVKFG